MRDWRTHLAPRQRALRSWRSKAWQCGRLSRVDPLPCPHLCRRRSALGCDECCVRPSLSLDTRASLLKNRCLGLEVGAVFGLRCTRGWARVRCVSSRVRLALCTQHTCPISFALLVRRCKDPLVEAAKTRCPGLVSCMANDCSAHGRASLVVSVQLGWLRLTVLCSPQMVACPFRSHGFRWLA